MKIDKTKVYKVLFVHWLDEEDQIEDIMSGKGYFRFRNMLLDLGYQVRNVEEVSI